MLFELLFAIYCPGTQLVLFGFTTSFSTSLLFEKLFWGTTVVCCSDGAAVVGQAVGFGELELLQTTPFCPAVASVHS